MNIKNIKNLIYLNETAVKSIELLEMVHSDEPLLNKNLTKGFFNHLTGTANEIQKNRNETARLLKNFRRKRDLIISHNSMFGETPRKQRNLNYINGVLQNVKNDPGYYTRTGYIPHNQVQPAQPAQPAYAYQ